MAKPVTTCTRPRLLLDPPLYTYASEIPNHIFFQMEINETINKIRNPYFYANFYFKRLWTQRKDDSDNPQMNLFLYEHLHPSFSESASVIE